jgi:hypothetical protein
METPQVPQAKRVMVEEIRQSTKAPFWRRLVLSRTDQKEKAGQVRAESHGTTD